MPRRRKPQQQTLVVPPGTNPAFVAGTPEAREKMAKVRAAKTQQQKDDAVRAAWYTVDKGKLVSEYPHYPREPKLGALMAAQFAALGDLDRVADALMQGKVTGTMTKPQVVVMLMKGFELGLGSVESVQSMYLTPEGKVEMQAELVRALILRAGVGYIIPSEMTDSQATVTAVRYGVGDRPDVTLGFSYSVGDAQRAGLLDGAGAHSWRSFPRAMCFARATTEAGRAMFADVLLAAGYGYGELEPREGVVEATGQEMAPEPAMPEAEPGVPTKKQEEPIPEPGPSQPTVPPAPLEAPQEETEGSPPNPRTPPPTYPDPGSEPTASAAQETAEPKRYKSGVVHPSPASPAAPEARTAPPSPRPSPRPSPPTPTVYQGVPTGWPEGRPVRHSFPIQGVKGEVVIVQTGGALKPQLSRLGDLTTNRAGQPNWMAMQDMARAYLDGKGLARLTYLTEAEATELIGTLEASTAYVSGNGGTDIRHELLLDAMLAEAGVTEHKAQVLAFMERSYGTSDVNAMPTESFKKALVEIRNLATDPAVFGHMMATVLAQQPA